MDTYVSSAEFLQKFGGWGVSVVLLFGIIYLYKSTSTIIKKQNDQFIEVLKETTSLLQQNVDQSHRVENLLQRLERLLDH